MRQLSSTSDNIYYVKLSYFVVSPASAGLEPILACGKQRISAILHGNSPLAEAKPQPVVGALHLAMGCAGISALSPRSSRLLAVLADHVLQLGQVVAVTRCSQRATASSSASYLQFTVRASPPRRCYSQLSLNAPMPVLDCAAMCHLPPFYRFLLLPVLGIARAR